MYTARGRRYYVNCRREYYYVCLWRRVRSDFLFLIDFLIVKLAIWGHSRALGVVTPADRTQQLLLLMSTRRSSSARGQARPRRRNISK